MTASRDGLTPGAFVRVEAGDSRMEGVLAAIDAEGLRLDPPPGGNELIAWTSIRRVSLKEPRPREWLGIGLFAAVGAAALGFCGALIDDLDWPRHESAAMSTGAAIGALGGALIAAIIAFSRANHEWQVVFESMDPEEESAPTLEDRLLRGGTAAVAVRERTAQRRLRENILAWLLFLAIVLTVFLVLSLTDFG
jgi:hypothetical protein